MEFSLKNKKALVVGLAKSGVAAACLLKREGASVTVTDEKNEAALAEPLGQLPADVRVQCGIKNFSADSYDLVVISPGVPYAHPELERIRQRGVPVWSELELGWRFVQPAQTLAITGTNGKTTTTSLLGEIVKESGRPVVVGGNIGTPLSALVDQIEKDTVLVLEVSSYQLEGIETFHPNVGAILNVTPDHLARHKTMEGYMNAKARLFLNGTSRDTAVLNERDEWCRRIGSSLSMGVRWFPTDSLREIASHIKLPGEHNLENAMAATAMAEAAGIERSATLRALSSFQGVKHRIQLVGTLKGVSYVNDSKATNVDSTLVALKSYQGPLFLILGGQHKGAPYTPLIPLLKNKVKEILTIGEARGEIEKDLAGVVPITFCETLERAVRYAASRATSGDVVLLSPACASFDQFKNYEHRGDQFMELVKNLKT